uniref:Potassium channel domain-containing protein n=1 Tax=Acrobeloides nanus TaxID=290746 RepID=A0A914CPN9_9BILA
MVPLKDRANFKTIFEKYSNEIAELLLESKFVRENDFGSKIQHSNENLWDFGNSLFYATAVLTTIGNTRLIPLTVIGRIFTMIYAFVGIPLLLVTIADMAKILNDFIYWLLRKHQHFNIMLLLRKKAPIKNSLEQDSSENYDSSIEDTRIPLTLVSLLTIVYLASGSLILQYLLGWRYFDSFYFYFNSMNTIGFDNFSPPESTSLVFIIFYVTLGLALRTICLEFMAIAYIRRIHDFGGRVDEFWHFIKDKITQCAYKPSRETNEPISEIQMSNSWYKNSRL